LLIIDEIDRMTRSMKYVSSLLLAAALAACSGDTPKTGKVADTATAAVSPSTATAAAPDDAFGGAITIPRTSSVTVTDAINKPELHAKPILVRGTINDVCQRKGCWLMVTDGVEEMRVTFKDYAFFVPTDSDGRNVMIEGVVTEEEISEGAAKHYASESMTADSASVNEIKGPQKIVTMEATAVAIAPEI
jgi:hypothetical protein